MSRPSYLDTFGTPSGYIFSFKHCYSDHQAQTYSYYIVPLKERYSTFVYWLTKVFNLYVTHAQSRDEGSPEYINSTITMLRQRRVPEEGNSRKNEYGNMNEQDLNCDMRT